MTTPESFSYTDDSVIARVAVEVPSQALSDISQLSSAMGAMRTQLEAIARAQGDWLDYLQQIPVIAEKANQAYRDQITQLERISYIQNELGTSGGMGGGANVSPETPMRTSGSPGGGGYSTAAPAGYANPFQGMAAGMGGGGGGGAGGGGVPGGDIGAQLAAMSANDERMLPNMASARGMATNPALMGTIGAVIAGYGALGRGNDDPGGMHGTSTGAERGATQPSDPNEGGQSIDAEQQRPDTLGGSRVPLWRKLADKVGPEVMAGVGATRAGKMIAGLGGAKNLGDLFSGKAADAADAVGADAGGLMGKMGLMKKLGLGAVGVGAALKAFDVTQDVGERMTKLQMLGSEEGGDWKTGLKEDVHARAIALDPFINSEESRKAISIPMSQGLKGDSRDEIRDLLINNFKELGMSMAQSASIEFANLRGGKLTDENVLKSRSSNEATLNTMKELAGADGNSMSLSQRTQMLNELTSLLKSSGGNQQSIERSALQWQEGFGNDSMALREGGSKIVGGTMRSNKLMAIAGQKLGVTGMMPGAMEAELTDMGYSETEITELAAGEAAKYVSGLPKRNNRIAAFRSLMADSGVDLDWPEAKDLYDKVTSGKSGTERANEIISRQSGKGPSAKKSRTGAPGSGGNQEDADWSASHPGYEPSENAERVGDNFTEAQRQKDLYAPGGRTPRQLPQSATDVAPRPTMTAQGQVTGEVRITVDQQGRVTAPPTIQLSGQQKAAMAGYGSAQLNNAPPGDPTYYHAYTAMSGG